MDGVSKYQDYCDFIKENNTYPAMAATEHGIFSGTLDFIDTCNKNNIKPIVGCEIYMTTESIWQSYLTGGDAPQRYHLVILCKNLQGYKDLIGMNNEAIRNGMVYVSRIKRWYVLITPELLSKWNNGNWIVSNACLGSYAIHPYTFGDDLKETVNRVGFLRELFKDDYYFEFQVLNCSEQKKMNEIQCKIMSKLPNQKAIVTSDAHYLRKEQGILRDIMMAMNWKVSLSMFRHLNQEKRNTEEQMDIYLRTNEQMLHEYYEYEHNLIIPENIFAESCDNTIKIADSIEPFSLNKVQDLDVVKEYFDGDTNEILLTECKNGLMKIKDKIDDPKKYVEVLKKEYEVIKEKNFAPYFLALKKTLSEFEKRDVWTGVGRGSSSSFLINYLLGITKVDPIKYGLMSERFLSPDRDTAPDIDTDCEDRKAAYDIFQYCFPNHEVLLISNKATLAVKNLMKYVWKTLDICYPNPDGAIESSDAISKHLDANYNVLKLTLEEFLEDPFVSEQIENYELVHRDISLREIMRSLYKNLSGISVHAGGLIITEKNENIIPLVPLMDNDVAPYASAFSESGAIKELESIGQIKFDMLGLANLRMMHRCVDTISKSLNIPKEDILKNIDPEFMNLNDNNIFENFRKGYTQGIFQFSSDGMVELLKRMKVDKVEDLSLCNAAFRPGPLAGGLHELLIAAKQDINSVKRNYSEKLWSIISEHLEISYGVLVYEESAMKVGQAIGDFSPKQLNNFRKFLKDGKVVKLANPEKHAKLEKEFHAQFVEKGIEKGIEKKELEEFWIMLEQFSEYSFNCSHSVNYSILAVQTQFFNTYYPGFWYAAVLNETSDPIKELPLIMKQAKERGLNYTFRVPRIDNINSSYTFKPNNNDSKEGTIYIGMNDIKGIGEKATDALKSDVFQNAKIESVKDIVDLAQANKFRAITIKTLLTLANIGMLDILGTKEEVRAQILIEKDKEYRIEESSTGKRSKYRPMTIQEAMEKDQKDNGTGNLFFWQAEQEALGISLSDNPASHLIEKVKTIRKDKNYMQYYVDAGIVLEVENKLSKNQTRYYTIKMSSIIKDETIDLFIWEKQFKHIGENVLKNIRKYGTILIFAHENT